MAVLFQELDSSLLRSQSPLILALCSELRVRHSPDYDLSWVTRQGGSPLASELHRRSRIDVIRQSLGLR